MKGLVIINTMEKTKFFKKLWESGISKKNDVNQYFKYWDGTDDAPSVKNAIAKKAEAENIIFPIIETKTALILDAKMDIQTVPALGSFESVKTMKEMQEVADIYQDAIKDVERRNNFESMKETIVRYGSICGFAPVDVIFDSQKSAQGEVKLSVLEPDSVRWDSAAKSIDNALFFGTEIVMSAYEAKKLYGYDTQGNEREEIIKLIDKHANPAHKNMNKDDYTGKAQGWQKPDGEAGLSYVIKNKDNTGDTQKVIKIVRLYLRDYSLYLPDESDDTDTKENKEKWLHRYPFGRVVVFIEKADEDAPLLHDEAMQESEDFGISVFNPVKHNKIEGRSEVKPLMFVQQRLNAAYVRLWWCIGAFISTVLLPNGALDLGEGDFVNNAVTKTELPAGVVLNVLTNNTLSNIEMLLNVINSYQQTALRIARINEVILSGETAGNVTSGEQVSKLNESPMVSIRQMQRNFRNFLVDYGNKILSCIVNNYDMQRLIKLSTRVDGAQYAIFGVKRDEQSMEVVTDSEGNPIRTISLLGDDGNIARVIEINPDWKFQVEIVSGSEIPRSRKENAAVVSELYASGKLGNPDDLELKELVFNSIDLPNKRAFLELLKKQEESKPKTVPIFDDTSYMKAVTDAVKSLASEGFIDAGRALLKANGLPDTTESILTAPIREVTSKSNASEVQMLRTRAGENPQAEIQDGEKQIEEFVKKTQGN